MGQIANIYFIGVVVSVAVYLTAGLFAGKRIKNINDYYVSGRNAPTLLITGTLFASMLSTNGFLGDTAYAYAGNITTLVLINVFCAAGYVLGPLFFGRYIRRAEISTMPEYFGARFNSGRIRSLAGIITIVSLTAYLLAVIQGTSLLMMTLTGLPQSYCLGISWLCFTFLSFFSGSSGVILTDTIMFIVFLAGTIAGGLSVFDAAGGLDHLIVNLMNHPATPAGLLSYHGELGGAPVFDMMSYTITVGLIWMAVVAVSPWQAGRNLMAKSEHVTFRAGAVSAVCTVVFLTYLYLMAVAAILLNAEPRTDERVILWLSFNAMPKLTGVLMLSGVMAAGLSSATTFLSVIGFSLAADVLPLRFKSEKRRLAFTRWVTLLFSVLALVLAYWGFSGIRIISWFAGAVIASSWTYAAFAGVWSAKLTERGAFFSMLGGLAGYLGAKCLKELFGLPLRHFFDPFFIGLGLSALCGILLSAGQERSPAEIAFFRKLHVISPAETAGADYRRDRTYGGFLAVAGLLFGLALLFGWAIPAGGIKPVPQ